MVEKGSRIKMIVNVPMYVSAMQEALKYL